MPELSVVIITLNEEKNIGRCLESVKDLADEVVVVDSFSTDNTEEICKKYAARFFQNKWMGYAATKNYANSLAKYNWILSLDADECLSEELKTEIRYAKTQQSYFYSFKRLTNYCGKWIRHSGWYPDIKIRLFDRRKTKWSGEYVHETLVIEGKEKVMQLKGDCLHYSYYTIEQHVQQVEKYSLLGAKELFDQGAATNGLAIFLKTGFKFFRNYFMKLGILDGYYGLMICKITAWGTYRKLSMLQELRKGKQN